MIKKAFSSTLTLLALTITPLFAQELEQFGSLEYGDGALIGIFYDFKQTQDLQPIPGAGGRYTRTIDQFLVDGLDESYLNEFFRAGLPLYATQIYISRMSADNAPRAFGVQDVVDPKHWIIHYKGQVAPPEDGTYRFVGGADDVLVVAINQEVVLVGNHPSTVFQQLAWEDPQSNDPRPTINGHARYGKWIELKAGEPVDIDIIVGERPGGIFHVGLAYQVQGETYSTTRNGNPMYPLFQVAPGEVNSNTVPTDRPPWTIFP